MMTLVHTLAVAEYLNFRHAANALGVAQSSVSARVKALEEDLLPRENLFTISIFLLFFSAKT